MGEDAFSSTSETDSITDIFSDEVGTDDDALASFVGGDCPSVPEDSDDFLPCHFWALNAMRRLESGGALYSFPRRNVQKVALEAEEDDTSCAVLLTVLNRWSANGAKVTFRMDEPWPKAEPTPIHADNDTSEAPEANDAQKPSAEPVKAWALPQVDTNVLDPSVEETDKGESVVSMAMDQNVSGDDDDDDEEHLSDLVKQYQRRHGIIKSEAKPPAPPAVDQADVQASSPPVMLVRNKPKLCSQGNACSYALENRCDKAHDLQEWDPCCKHDKKCRRKNRCPYWHQDLEPIARYLWRMCHVVQDNFFYQRQDFIDTYLSATPAPSPARHTPSDRRDRHDGGGDGARRGRPPVRKPASSRNGGRR